MVPGAFDGWLLMLREFGTWRLADVLEFAIGFAERGFPVAPAISRTIAQVEQLFRDEWTTSAEVFLGNGIPQPGSLFRNPAAAATYQRIADGSRGGTRGQELDRARALWYEGFVAEAIDGFVRSEVMDATGTRHAGFLTADDLASWRATLEAPSTLDYRGHTVFKTGPWGQGPVFLQQLALLAGFDLGAMGVASADLVHTVVECAKLAFADREAWYGDPDFADVPLDLLLSEEYADERRALVGTQASPELRPGGPEPRLPSPVAGRLAAGVGEPTRASGDTVHLDVVDRHGNIVSATPSGGWLWSSPVVPGLGFPLGTRAQMFWLEEGLPNSLEPHKRPRTTLSPSLAFPVLEMLLGGSGQGSAGLDREITEIEQSILDAFIRIILQDLSTAWQAGQLTPDMRIYLIELSSFVVATQILYLRRGIVSSKKPLGQRLVPCLEPS